jgi:hypothetical protein
MIASMKPTLRFAVLIILLAVGATILPAGTPTPLFNGRDLTGWDVFLGERPPGEVQKVVQVSDGVIHIYKDSLEGSTQPHGYLITQAEYADYRLSLEYKWGVKKFAPRAEPDVARDAGLCFHVQSPDVVWPVSVECQIQEGDTGDAWLIKTRATSRVNGDTQGYWPAKRSGGSEVTKGEPGMYRRFMRYYCHERPDWNHLEIVVRGDRATYFVNGQLVNEVTAMKRWNEATKEWLPLTKGKILLQAEGAEILYRNVVLEPLGQP